MRRELTTEDATQDVRRELSVTVDDQCEEVEIVVASVRRQCEEHIVLIVQRRDRETQFLHSSIDTLTCVLECLTDVGLDTLTVAMRGDPLRVRHECKTCTSVDLVTTDVARLGKLVRDDTSGRVVRQVRRVERWSRALDLDRLEHCDQIRCIARRVGLTLLEHPRLCRRGVGLDAQLVGTLDDERGDEPELLRAHRLW